jgi:hypothetical protein
MTGDINNRIIANPNYVALITFLLNNDIDYKSQTMPAIASEVPG